MLLREEARRGTIALAGVVEDAGGAEPQPAAAEVEDRRPHELAVRERTVFAACAINVELLPFHFALRMDDEH